MSEDRYQGEVVDRSSVYSWDSSNPDAYISEILGSIGLSQTSESYQDASEAAKVANLVFTDIQGDNINGPLRRYAIFKTLDLTDSGISGLRVKMAECLKNMEEGLKTKVTKETINEKLRSFDGKCAQIAYFTKQILENDDYQGFDTNTKFEMFSAINQEYDIFRESVRANGQYTSAPQAVEEPVNAPSDYDGPEIDEEVQAFLDFTLNQSDGDIPMFPGLKKDKE